ncbi:MAG TPA: glycine zipper 2TM domain-containing protein [Rhodocyclaceae bacterium]
MKHAIFAIVVGSAIALTGCASSLSGSAYSRDQARGEMTVRLGVVDSVRRVQIEGTKSPVGSLAGGALGGVAGSQMGKGTGSTVGAIAGVIAGGLAGSAIEEGVTRQNGLEITVRLENGQVIAVTQAADEEFRPGERVRVLSGRGTTRVSH